MNRWLDNWQCNEPLQRRVAMGIMGVCCVITLIMWLGPLQLLFFSSKKDTQKNEHTPLMAVKIPAIDSWHLFGEYTEKADDALPETSANLTLIGLFATDDPEEGTAVITIDGRPAQPYRVGESLPGGLVVHAIYTDRVILKRDGQLEVLALPQPDASVFHGR